MAIRTGWSVEVVPAPVLVANAFFAAADKIAQMRNPLEDTAKIVSNEFESNFAAEGRPQGWASLAESTIADRERQGYAAGPILTRSGELRSAATDPGSWDISQGGQSATATLSTPSYGEFHITGFRGGWQHDREVPARDWSYIGPDADEQIDQVWEAWVMDPLEAVPG